MKTAVILAAGLGSRFKKETEVKPKGFIKLEGKTLIEMSLDKLLANGIEKIFIGTGAHSEFYENLTIKYPQITCVKNNDFAQTGSMYTLYNMRSVIDQDFLLLESDLFYEPRAVSLLVQEPHKNVILASGFTSSGDEVFIQADPENYLQNISKDKSVLSSIYGELTGLNKISFSLYQKMNAAFITADKKADYEHMLAAVSKENKIFIKKEENLIWCEIDTEEHYKRALYEIYPKAN